MKRYYFTYRVYAYRDVTLEAESLDEAKEKAYQKVSCESYKPLIDPSLELGDCWEVPEDEYGCYPLDEE